MVDVIESLKYTVLYELISPFIHRYEFHQWNRTGRNPPTPHLVKQQMVLKFAAMYKAKIFVETGTYLGVMIFAVKHAFDEVYTIELDEKLYRRAKRKFYNERNINMILGDSSKVLPGLLSKLDKPTIFWLDAHYSGGISAKGSTVTPIIHELCAILNHKLPNNVILVDDADLFTGENGYPTMKDIRNLVYGISTRFNVKNENNIIIIN